MKLNRYWNTGNLHLIYSTPLRDVRVGVWCVLSVGSVSGPVFCADTLNSERYSSGPVSFTLSSCCSGIVTAADTGKGGS
jgi:hypothetical protein